jgi:hypothetical protein
MNGGLFMIIPYNGFMCRAGQKTIITLTNDAIVLNEDASNFEPMTWRPFGGG